MIKTDEKTKNGLFVIRWGIILAAIVLCLALAFAGDRISKLILPESETAYTSASIWRCGNNLCNITNGTYTSVGRTYTVANGKITVSITADIGSNEFIGKGDSGDMFPSDFYTL